MFPERGPTAMSTVVVLVVLAVSAALTSPAAAEGARALGDTLTVVMRPILPVPEIVVPGDSFVIEAMAPQSTTGWAVQLARGAATHALSVDSTTYESSFERWFLSVTVPADVPAETYGLEVTASGGIYDEVDHAVTVRQSIEDDFYFIHVTDSHLPTHKYYYESGADTDTTEMEDLHEVIDDINIINPAFVLFTGDIINEGELEDFLDKRYFTRTQRILQRFDVPVYLTAGNHDVGGWDDTPPPDGTARRNWWKFFGWRYLNDPPPGEGVHTQNYSFDYGDVHFIGIEAYNNYDRWRTSIYGDDSFTDDQLDWLVDDIGTVSPATPIIAFHHRDFQDQLSLGTLGIDGALSGHIHYTDGDIGAHPFNLSTETVCDGERAMRLVRVSGSSVTPSEPIDAGSSGGSLRLLFDAANDGTNSEITATVDNNQPENFEHGLIRFLVDASQAPYTVDNGELLQMIVDGSVATCYVQVAMPAHSNTYVTISPDESSGVDEDSVPSLALLGPAFPNPAGTRATVAFSLGASGHAIVSVYDISGRLVTTLLDGPAAAGPHRVAWDLAGAGDVASGIYIYRIESLGKSVSGKMVVVR
ncbi:MAG: metallophosphoesterase [Candidatus Eisenbacteria bacterium]